MTTKHTPAPWTQDGQHVMKGREILATVNSIFGEPEMLANAKLIAAAPLQAEKIEKLESEKMELLEALLNFVNHGSCFDERDMQQARAAIEKATD